jgi:hypothetical protein
MDGRDGTSARTTMLSQDCRGFQLSRVLPNDPAQAASPLHLSRLVIEPASGRFVDRDFGVAGELQNHSTGPNLRSKIVAEARLIGGQPNDCWMFLQLPYVTGHPHLQEPS